MHCALCGKDLPFCINEDVDNDDDDDNNADLGH